MTERAFWLAWSQLPKVGPVLLQRMEYHFGSLAAAWQAEAIALSAVEGVGIQTAQSWVQQRQRIDPIALLEQHLHANPHFWTPGDDLYPRLLLEIPNPPPVLYYRGIVEPQENQGLKPAIAIVGTRDVTDYGRRWTYRLSRQLAERGFTIISGMAQGVDTQAHRGCLDAGGRTIAVFGTGVDIIYPPGNQALYNQILEQGLVISEYPTGVQPNRAHFPQRNRIVAGLSRAVLVTEAPTQSGALITARLANEFGRDIYVLPGRIDDQNSKGCLGLISKGAQVLISEGYLLELLSQIPQLDPVVSKESAPTQQLSLFPASPAPVPPLPPLQHQVLEAVRMEPTSVDAIVQQTGLTSAEVSSTLLELELLGLVSQLPGMRYQR
ncbi:DNA-processing protein DprA [Roseofilum sp. BLCC_M154]|uniref:DNA-processing protein DprA n=1 Tax=Roseofilum acuticapitatum BLCC-M154 TaxID=3022444 RepID=A0ABT7AMB9_9CYAN|nr:DNA-processing protein DprA [Roseofilum acuticapitatum]MDJ1168032.1 DNA-processing protein DprA [Roseofilum acuticapitatum BLCC-M154]